MYYHQNHEYIIPGRKEGGAFQRIWQCIKAVGLTDQTIIFFLDNLSNSQKNVLDS